MREHIVLGKSWAQVSRTLDDFSRNWERCRKSSGGLWTPIFVRKSVFVGDTETNANYTYCTGHSQRGCSLLFLDIRHSELDWTCRISIEALEVGLFGSVKELAGVDEFGHVVLRDLFSRPPRPEPRAWTCPACGAVYDIAVLTMREDGRAQCQNCGKWVWEEPSQTSPEDGASNVE